MNKIKYFSLFEEETGLNKKGDIGSSPRQNNIEGSSPNNALALFPQDAEPGKANMDSVPGYNFIMASAKISLWVLEGRECHLIGQGSPFARSDYAEYLSTLPDYAVSMLKERMEHYGVEESENALLFGINGTVRVLQAHNEGMFYIAYPDEDIDYEVVSDINDSSLTDKFKKMVERVVGSKMISWLHKKFGSFSAGTIKKNVSI